MLQSQIQELIPAKDWYAVLTDEQDAISYKPLVCYALVLTGEETEVRPMLWEETTVRFADEIEGFIDIEHLDEIDARRLHDEDEDEQ